MTPAEITLRGRWIIAHGLPPLRAAKAARKLTKLEQDAYHDMHRELEHYRNANLKRREPRTPL